MRRSVNRISTVLTLWLKMILMVLLKGGCKMSHMRQEEILKSDQLRTVSECEEAIRVIAKNVGKDAFDIWSTNEKNLSLKASSVSSCLNGKKRMCIQQLVVTVLTIITLVWYKLSHGEVTMLFLVLMVYMLPFIVASFCPNTYVFLGQIYRQLLGSVFSIELFLLSYLPWSAEGASASREVGEYVRLFGYFMFGVLLTVALYHLVIERPYSAMFDMVKNELSILRSVRGILCCCDARVVTLSEKKSSRAAVGKFCLFVSLIGCVTALAYCHNRR